MVRVRLRSAAVIGAGGLAIVLLCAPFAQAGSLSFAPSPRLTAPDEIHFRGAATRAVEQPVAEANRLMLEWDGARLVFSDDYVIVPDHFNYDFGILSFCTFEGFTARCDPPTYPLSGGYGRVVLLLDDGDDQARVAPPVPVTTHVDGGAGRDRISGAGVAFGGGDDDVITGDEGFSLLGYFEDRYEGTVTVGDPGNDRFRVRDDAIDRVYCGPGQDRVTADPIDELHDCEIVDAA